LSNTAKQVHYRNKVDTRINQMSSCLVTAWT